MSPELFVFLKALMGFGLPLGFGLYQLHSLRKMRREEWPKGPSSDDFLFKGR